MSEALEALNFSIQFYVGAGTTPGLTPDQVQYAVREILADNFGSGTTWQGEGVWTDPHGEVIKEECIVGSILVRIVEPLDVVLYRKKARQVAATLAARLKQQSVIFVFTPVGTVEFVPAPVTVLAPSEPVKKVA